MNVYQKLNQAREIFHKSELKKSGHNKFANYYYFELGDFIIPALQIFKEVGLTSVIRFTDSHAFMEIVNNEKPEEKIVIGSPMSTAALKGCHEVQNLGAVQTYIRRYLWVAALEIVEHDALDSSEGVDTSINVSVLADLLTTINDSSTEEELKKAYALAFNATKGDKNAQKKVIDAKDKKKAALA